MAVRGRNWRREALGYTRAQTVPGAATGTPAVGDPYTAAALALFAAMSTSPTIARKGQIDAVIVALQTAGIWALLDVLYVLAAADAQAALLNWKNPATFTASATSTFAVDRGYTGDGAATFVDTTFNPSTAGGNYTQNSATFAVWTRTEAQFATTIAGSGTTGTGVASINPRTSSDLASIRINATTADTAANSVAAGLTAVSRSSSSATAIYKSGALLGSPSRTSVAMANSTLTLGKFNGTFSTAQIAAALAAANLDATQHGVLNTALTGYMQGVGAA